jgi:hypothetical protein
MTAAQEISDLSSKPHIFTLQYFFHVIVPKQVAGSRPDEVNVFYQVT